jgi:tRNA dimethylallyltransferase
MAEAQNLVKVVIGPTGSGKTDYALKLALAELGKYEIVNADSMQVYKELNIGNNKGDLSKLMGEIRYWMFDVVSVVDNYSVADYQKQAREVISDIHFRGRIPILVGGSGLYIKAALSDYQFVEQDSSWPQRSVLTHFTVAELQAELTKLGFDLEQLNNSDRNNSRRLINLILKQGDSGDRSNGTIMHFQMEVKSLSVNRVTLKERLLKRAQAMLDAGLVKEVEGLIAKYGIERISPQVKSASGYKQVFELLANDRSGDIDALALSIANSHYKLAKKQETWNKKYFQTI